MPRRACAVALAVLLVLSGLPFPTGAGIAAADEGAPPDPAEDALGWEDGYWHNETLAVNASDGLSSAELEALVARTMARVEHVRELEFNRTVPVSVESREAYRERVANRSTNATLRTFDNAKFEALFLIGEDADSIEVQDQNSGASVLGFYDPRSDEIVIVTGNESAVSISEATLAHELVHALQDQHFDLSRYRGETRDQVNAFDGLIEGDASYVEYLYTDRRCANPDHPWNGTCVTPSGDGGGGGELANIGVYFVKFQPYSDGPTFVEYFRSRAGWAAVNALYEDPPESAEQVIHPEKYGVDSPTNVTLADRQTGTWTRLRPTGRSDYAELGQASVASMLVYPLYRDADPRAWAVPPETWLNLTVSGEISTFDPLNYGFPAAAGWGGDRMHVYRNGANETAYVWRIVWDSSADAREFVDSYREVLVYWGAEEVERGTYVIETGAFADAFHVSVDRDAVTIVNAPSVAALSEVRPGVLATPSPSPTRSPIPPSSASPVPSASPTVTTTATATAASPSTEFTITPGQPGFGFLAAVAALLFAAALALRRARR